VIAAVAALTLAVVAGVGMAATSATERLSDQQKREDRPDR
jgi:hypothetical protein